MTTIIIYKYQIKKQESWGTSAYESDMTPISVRYESDVSGCNSELSGIFISLISL